VERGNVRAYNTAFYAIKIIMKVSGKLDPMCRSCCFVTAVKLQIISHADKLTV
jgi:hypothetical protein